MATNEAPQEPPYTIRYMMTTAADGCASTHAKQMAAGDDAHISLTGISTPFQTMLLAEDEPMSVHSGEVCDKEPFSNGVFHRLGSILSILFLLQRYLPDFDLITLNRVQIRSNDLLLSLLRSFLYRYSEDNTLNLPFSSSHV